MQVARPLGQLTAIHIGHDDVGQNQADFTGVLLQVSQGFAAVAGRPSLVSQGADHPAGG
jgi:hypothetical protein